MYLCDPSLKPIYDIFKSTGCAARDVTLNPMASPDQPCDALSMAIQFTAETAAIGADFSAPEPDAGVCGAGWVDSCE